LEAQAHQGLSLPEEGREPFLDYPSEAWRGAMIGRLLVVCSHAPLASLIMRRYLAPVGFPNGISIVEA
jgi:hypothetical protein